MSEIAGHFMTERGVSASRHAVGKIAPTSLIGHPDRNQSRIFRAGTTAFGKARHSQSCAILMNIRHATTGVQRRAPLMILENRMTKTRAVA